MSNYSGQKFNFVCILYKTGKTDYEKEKLVPEISIHKQQIVEKRQEKKNMSLQLFLPLLLND